MNNNLQKKDLMMNKNLIFNQFKNKYNINKHK